jgi:FkbM family methyltransferase
MKVTRNGHTFTVSDDDLSGDWGFWERFANGTWEPEILDRMSELLDGGTYLDIGSWIGPQLLVASLYADRCVGFEPDPTAFEVLKANVAPLENVTVRNVAVADYDGMTTITTDGDSMSRTGQGTHHVACHTLAYLAHWHDLLDVSLVKIDIEGAEQDVFPQASDLIRSWDCPVFLSVHPWVTSDPLRGCAGWRVEVLADHEALLWPV